MFWALLALLELLVVLVAQEVVVQGLLQTPLAFELEPILALVFDELCFFLDSLGSNLPFQPESMSSIFILK